MHGHTHPTRLRATLVEPWLEPLTRLLVETGLDPHEAPLRAHLGLEGRAGTATRRSITGDFQVADTAMTAFTDLLLDRP